MALRDESVRQFFLSPRGVLCFVLGLFLNMLGRWFVRRATRKAATVASEVPDFIDVVSVHLRAGKPPALAFRCAAQTCDGTIVEAAHVVMQTHESGHRFVESLTDHRGAFPLNAQPLIDALIDTERDGLSPRELFERISSEAHSQRRREAERKIRALPVRLTLPLVGCVLPAYVLLAVVPLLAGQLSSVDIDPHPLMEGTP
jgi:Flp pilus assembly protein TadB